MTQPEQAIAGILAIVAQRMKATSGKLDIVGCTSNTSRDKGTALARRRAIAVQDALIALGVPRNRLRIDARSLPAMPTRSSNPDDAIQAEQENRRVELVPADMELMAPVTLASVRKTTDPEIVHVRSTVNSYPGVASATLTVASKATSTTGTTANGAFNEQVNVATFMGTKPSPVVATLTVRDSAGTTVVERDTLPVALLTVERKRADRRADTEIERYSLILFAFNDDKITAEHESVLTHIRKKVQEGARVRIIGMTDSMGSSDYNLDLSRRRAKSVAGALGLPDSSIMAMGSTLPRFTNASPEGRAYNRTVVIEITTNVR